MKIFLVLLTIIALLAAYVYVPIGLHQAEQASTTNEPLVP